MKKFTLVLKVMLVVSICVLAVEGAWLIKHRQEASTAEPPIETEQAIEATLEATEPTNLVEIENYEKEPAVETAPIETQETEPVETQATELDTNVESSEAVTDANATTTETTAEVQNNTTETTTEVSSTITTPVEAPTEEFIMIVNELNPYSEGDYPDDGQVVYTTNWVNVRSEPALEGELLGKIEEGERVFRYETSYGWSKIYYKNDIGYISNKYVDSQRVEPVDLYEEVNEKVYAGHDVNIRLAPSTYAPSAGKLKQGESVRRIGVGINGWSQVMYKNQMYFINSRYLSTDKNFVIPLEWFTSQANNNTAMNGTNGATNSTNTTSDTTTNSTTTNSNATTAG